MTDDPVIHDQHLNKAFRQDVPKKPEPESDSLKIEWSTVVPKYIDVRGIQVTPDNMDTLARIMRWDKRTDDDGVDYLLVPTVTGDAGAIVGYWILIADNDWDLITVCSAAAFTRNYEVKS